MLDHASDAATTCVGTACVNVCIRFTNLLLQEGDITQFVILCWLPEIKSQECRGLTPLAQLKIEDNAGCFANLHPLDSDLSLVLAFGPVVRAQNYTGG